MYSLIILHIQITQGYQRIEALIQITKEKRIKVVEQFEAINDAFCERFLEENEDEGKEISDYY